ncbi:MAG: hypothetical protein V3U20_01060, partial [Thermoplasmata archaeon]
MRHEHGTKQGYTKNKSSRVFISGTVIIVLSLVFGVLIQIFPAFSEPIVTDNLDGTMTANWALDNSSDYNLFNLSLENGSANLMLNSFWWNQSTQSEFETGSMFNINTSASPGDLLLNSTFLGAGENLIKNGNFETSANWSFGSSDNITSEWSSSGEYGKLYHYSASNPIYEGEQNLSIGMSDGNNGGSAALDVVDALQSSDDGKYWRVSQNEYISITGFDVTGRTGKITSIVLWASHRVDPSRYDGDSMLEYKNESGVFRPTFIKPSTSTLWENQSHDITDGYSFWTWGDIANLELNFTNNDTNPQNNFVEWD